jgi:RecA-family ATPase
MPATGAAIWFGAGSTGKTQLLLWLAAHIAAADDKAPRQWLGADLNVRGHVLVLTAEDLREHVLQRIGMIARRMIDQSGGSDEEVAALCRRIHVMAFLSMDMTEFT